jgi:hypothetical protein
MQLRKLLQVGINLELDEGELYERQAMTPSLYPKNKNGHHKFDVTLILTPHDKQRTAQIAPTHLSPEYFS